MLLKICGATSTADVDLLHSAGVDLVGLWHGVPGGSAELTHHDLSALAEACGRTGTLEPVLVTFLKDPGVLLDVAERSGLDWMQLHGYQPPAVVASLKRARADLTIVKVLHVDGIDCIEEPLLCSYARAGTDIFLFDAVTDTGKVGSTGRSLDSSAVVELADRMTLPFLLAGGISPDTRAKYDEVVEHPRFAGVDADTAARDATGRMRFEQIRSIRHHWPSMNDEQGAA